MKNWFQNLKAKLQIWMYGRYGQDELSTCLGWVSFFLLILSMVLPILYPLAFVPLVWSLFRCFSKNTYKRQQERYAYLRLIGKFKSAFRIRKRMWVERKTHRYYKCPGCKTYLRVPKGRGRIKITCSKCGAVITKKT